MSPALQLAYDLRHQLDVMPGAQSKFVDEAETDMSARDRIVEIIKHLEKEQNQ